MNKNLIIGVIVIAVIALGAAFIMKSAPSQDTQPGQSQEAVEPSGAMEDSDATGSAMSDEVREFIVTGSPFKFDVKEIKVKQGDKVKITFKNAQGTHDFVIDEFDVRTSVIQAGEEESIEFTADEAGSFEYYCSVANHRAQGMFGTLIVE